MGELRFPDAQYDAFGRLRMSAPLTLWDSNLLYDAAPLLWDDQETSGGGTASSHVPARAMQRISVSSGTAGVRVRQTFRRFHYKPGKSQLVFMTFVLGDRVDGVTQRVGLFDDNNGFYFECSGSSFGFGLRSDVSGSVIDKYIPSSEWSEFPQRLAQGPLYPDNINIDPSKYQILVIDYEWLGGGTVRYGFIHNDTIRYFHKEHHSNLTTAVYISSPHLPLRYEIRADGTTHTAGTFLDQICNTVITEGGSPGIGVLHSHGSGSTSVGPLSSGNLYAILGIRLKATHLDAGVELEDLSLFAGTNDNFEWTLVMNPDVASTQTWNNLGNNSVVQITHGTTVNILSSGQFTDGGYLSAKGSVDSLAKNARVLGASIAGVPDELYLAVRPLTANAAVYGHLTWRELS